MHQEPRNTFTKVGSREMCRFWRMWLFLKGLVTFSIKKGLMKSATTFTISLRNSDMPMLMLDVSPFVLGFIERPCSCWLSGWVCILIVDVHASIENSCWVCFLSVCSCFYINKCKKCVKIVLQIYRKNNITKERKYLAESVNRRIFQKKNSTPETTW